MKRASHFSVSRRRRGSVLIVVLVICLGLVSLTLVFGHAMLLAYRGADNELAGRQADAAILGAEQYAEVILNTVNNTTPGMFPDPATYQSAAVPVGDAMFWFLGVPGPADPIDAPTFRLADEAAKLNLNAANADMIALLPGMTADLAQAIVAWRQTQGTSTGSTVSLDAVKGAPFESVSELELVNGGTDPSVLYGDDANLNHVLDPEETDTGGLGQFNAGLYEYVTAFSREPNTLSDGTKRVNITNGRGRNRTAVQQLLTRTLNATRANQIMANLSRNSGNVRSVLEFYTRGGLTAAELDQLTPKICMTNAAYSVGLINVNTASAAVLACVPGITADIANQIVAAQTTPTAGVTTNLAWVAPIIGSAAVGSAGPWLTAQSYQVSADVAAVGRFGRGYRRTLFVLDNSSGTPQIVYRRNLAALGWALGKDARTSAAQSAAATGATPSP